MEARWVMSRNISSWRTAGYADIQARVPRRVCRGMLFVLSLGISSFNMRA